MGSLRRNPALLVPALAFAVLTYALAQTMLVPSLPAIQRDLHTTPAGVSSLLSAFFVSGAVTAGIAGRLGDMFGKRRVLVVVMALFTLGSLTAALSSTLAPILAGRIVMGCAVGAFPLAFSIVRDTLPAERVPTAISLFGGFGAAGAVIGQTCGGLVTDGPGYHWIFWISLITGAVATAGVVAFVPESAVKSPGRVDGLGALLLAAGLTAPLVAITETSTWGWAAPRTLGLIALGGALLAVFARHERRHPDPILHLPTLRVPAVALANVATLLVGFGLFGSSAIISQFVQMPRSTGYGLGASATAAGFFFVPGLAVMLVGNRGIGRLIARAGASRGLALGAGLGCVALAGMAASHGSRVELFVWLTCMYVGVAFAFSAAPVLILGVVPANLRGQSTAVNLIARNVGSSLGLQLAATVVTASARRGGLPTELGYTRAFILEGCGAGVALLLALAIPVRARALEGAAFVPENA